MRENSDIPCVILAGGQSRRMGQDKALLPFAGKTLVEFQYTKMKNLFEQVWIACKEKQLTGYANLPAIYEHQDNSSPLFGLQNAFKRVETEHICFMTVDTPLVSYRAMERLVDACCSQEAQAWVAQSDERTHPLVGIYARSVLPVVEKSIQEEDFRLMRLIDKIKCQKIDCGHEKQFINLNTPQAYEYLAGFEKESED